MAGLFAAALASAQPALARSEDANPSSKVDAQLRPHFDYFSYRNNRPATIRRPKSGPLVDVAYVDCGKGDSVNRKLRTVRDGGLLYIRSTEACHEPIMVDFPITIIGESSSPFEGATSHEATISPPADAPCIDVDRGVKGVVIKNLTIDGSLVGRKSCLIMGDRAEVTLSNVKMSYSGQASAIFAKRGKLLIDHSVIEATGYDPAVVVNGGRVGILHTTIRTGAIGMELTPGPDGQIDLLYVSVLSATSMSDPTNFADVGVIARGAGSPGGRILISHSDISGYRTGLRIERGLKADVGCTRVRHAREGIVSDGDELTVTNSAMVADIGVRVRAGHNWIERSWFGGFVGMPFEFDVGAELVESMNKKEPKKGCVAYPNLHPWCGPLPDIIMLEDPSRIPQTPGWNCAEFTIPPGLKSEPPPTHRSGLRLGVGLGGDVEGYMSQSRQ